MAKKIEKKTTKKGDAVEEETKKVKSTEEKTKKETKKVVDDETQNDEIVDEEVETNEDETDEDEVEEDAAEKAETARVKREQNQKIIIGVLATALVCGVLFFGFGLSTGTIKYGGESNTSSENVSNQDTNTNTDTNTTATHTPKATADTSGNGKVINNPNKQVKADGTLVRADALRFYLPSAFTFAKKADGRYIYNLTEGDGWADVQVYAEKSDKDARDYLLSKNPNLSISSDALVVSGWSWSTASAASGGIRAWATNYGDYVYAIILTVKIDSNETADAATMIPKTLYFEKLYK